MSNFDINLYSTTHEFYRFSTDDFALLQLGIGGYNISSLAKFLNVKDDDSFTSIKPLNEDVKEFFSNTSTTDLIDKLIGQAYLSDMKIMDFNFDEKIYEEVTGFSEIKLLDNVKFPPENFTSPSEGTIKDFLRKWNKVQRGLEPDEKIANGYKAVAYKIQNSLSGCITFDATLTVLNHSRTSKIQLYLLDNADSDSSRTITFNGSPLITEKPSTAYDMTYGFGRSEEHTSEL